MASGKTNVDKLIRLLALLVLPVILVYTISNRSSVTLPDHLKNITREQLLEDYDCFWDLLEKHDPSIYALDRDMVRQLKEEGRAKVEALKTDNRAAGEFVNILQSTIGGLNRVGHLAIVENSTLETYKAFGYDISIPDYSYLFADKKVAETAKWLSGKRVGGGRATKTSQASFEHIDGAISHIRIPSFSNSILNEDGPRVAEWIEEHIDDEAMIIDIRGNGGGTTRYWQDYIIPYLLDEDIRIAKYMYVKEWPTVPDCSKLEAYYEQGKASTEDIAYVESLPNFDLPEELEDATLYAGLYRAFSDSSIPHFKGDVYLLVDENTGSASEVLTRFIKESGLGTVIGMPTAVTSGSAASFTPIIYSLPNTGLCFRCYLGYSLNPDGSCGEVYAVMPDHIVEEDALEYCLDMIKGSRN